MREGNKVLILKYGTSNMYDCIDRHKAVIEKKVIAGLIKLEKCLGNLK